MTTLIERPAAASYLNDTDEHFAVDPKALISAEHGQSSMMEVAQAYFSLGERPIPLCDASHTQVSAQHLERCKSPGKAPLERDYPRFANKAPSAMDIVRMFGSHQGNIGGVVPEGRIVIGDRVRVGAGAVLVAPLTVGSEARIEAGTVVNHDVGSPASNRSGDDNDA